MLINNLFGSGALDKSDRRHFIGRAVNRELVARVQCSDVSLAAAVYANRDVARRQNNAPAVNRHVIIGACFQFACRQLYRINIADNRDACRVINREGAALADSNRELCIARRKIRLSTINGQFQFRVSHVDSFNAFGRRAVS